jgi:LysM repeat protein
VELVDWKQQVPPPATVDPLSAIAGVGAQINQEQSRVAARMSGISDRCDAVSKQAEKLEDGGERSEILHEASRLRISARRTADKGAHPGRSASKVLITQTMTLATLARNVGMTLEDLLRANPGLAATPQVTPGTEIWRS